MSEPTLRERILAYIQKQGTWVPSTDVQRLVTQRTKHTAKETVLLLKSLAESGDLKSDFREGSVFYCATRPTVKLRSKIEVVKDAQGQRAVETIEKVPLDPNQP